MFRTEGILVLYTSLSQTLNIDHDHSLYATGKKNKLSEFKIRKIQGGHDSEGCVIMLESVVYPRKFIRIKEGQCDLNVSVIHIIPNMKIL